MELTSKQLDAIEEYGKCQFSIDNIATIVEIPVDELRREISDKKSAAYKRYNKGRLLAEFTVRQNIIDLATRGSSQAQELFLKLRDELKIDEA